MKTSVPMTIKLSLAISALLASVLLVPAARSQDSDVANSILSSVPALGSANFLSVEVPPAEILRALRNQIANSKVKIQSAGSAEGRKQATEKLDSLLNDYFEKDMEIRRKELTDIKQRVEELDKQLQQRQTAKNEIVELQKKVIINEADGMGFFSGSRHSDPFGTVSPGEAGNIPFRNPSSPPPEQRRTR